ncbi:MAG: SURF1 family protein [Alphaproteobacteria bacterium]
MFPAVDRRRRPILWASLTAGLGIAALLALGTWQVERAAWKDGLQAELDARLALGPEPLPARIDESAPWRHRRATATGTFDHNHEMTVLAPARDGASGYHVVTPLVRAGADAVLVDRGWVPLAARESATRPVGELVVEGIVTVPAGPGPFTPDNVPGEGAWYWFDLPVMAAAAGVEALPVLLEASAAPVPGGLPEGGQTVVALRNEHRGYAATWYALAAALAVIYVLFLRRERRPAPP